VHGCVKNSWKIVRIYRLDLSTSPHPRIDTYYVPKGVYAPTLLDLLEYIKDEMDQTIAYRRSCKKGSCGSCSVNVNKENVLSCCMHTDDYPKVIEIYPLPHMTVVKDLVTDMTDFFAKYKMTKPWLISDSSPKDGEYLQTPKERDMLDGLYDCVLCACCTTACPNFWWNEDTFVGPAALLNWCRWIVDSRDSDTYNRLLHLKNNSGINNCHTIFTCTTNCPKGLNPADVISRLKVTMDRV
ncbi:succinate dehydrogenase iron-sulfur subunit, partial [Rickettsiales bacterium]|nr:succinate dehydrogenase iron-sulfur subunit [Rickettsiales bacterium]